METNWKHYTRITFCSLVCFWAGNINLSAQVIQQNYAGFTLWIDCSKRAATEFRYVAIKDTGQLKRKRHFKLDPNIPESCQQTSHNSYSHPNIRYDRGHLVPANHFDHSHQSISQSNYMTNILPQVATMNRGAWLLTEEIIECYRDISPVAVYGGTLWKDSEQYSENYLSAHDVHAPAAYWKIISTDTNTLAWVIPNSQDASRRMLDQYIVSISMLEQLTGKTFQVRNKSKNHRPEKSWPIPKGCDKS